MKFIFDYLDSIETELIDLRRELHKIPEPGFKEHKTGQIIKDFLTRLGLEVEVIAETGVIATLDCGTGATIAFRADMDALPIEEKTDLSYISQNQGFMHACGHDGHIAILLVVAKVLKKYKNHLNGKIKFIFQPAEEGPGGAKPMIEAGALENPAVDKIFGLHISNDLVTGEIGIHPRVASASADEVDIKIKGKAGHVSNPEEGIDSIVIAAQLINAVQSLLTRQINPNHAVTVNFGTIKGGDRRNIIADRVELQGTVRTTVPEVRKAVPEKFNNLLTGLTSAYGAEFEIDYNFGYPVLINSQELLIDIEADLKTIPYIKNLKYIKQPSLGSEDFAYYLQQVPGFFFRLGAANEDYNYPGHHSKFDFDEAALKIGVALFLKLAFIYLSTDIITENR